LIDFDYAELLLMEESSASEDTNAMAPDAVAPDHHDSDSDEPDQSKHFRTVSFYLFY
jgi:hypothetical protein